MDNLKAQQLTITLKGDVLFVPTAENNMQTKVDFPIEHRKVKGGTVVGFKNFLQVRNREGCRAEIVWFRGSGGRRKWRFRMECDPELTIENRPRHAMNRHESS